MNKTTNFKRMQRKGSYSFIVKIVLIMFVSLSIVSCVTDKSDMPGTTQDLSLKAKAHSELAFSYIEVGKYEIAQGELQKAIDADPDYLGSYFVAGVLELKLGSSRNAEKNFRIAAKDKNNSIAQHELGVLLCRTGREKESIAYFNLAIKNPLFARKGMSNLRAGECISKVSTNKARKYFNAALAQNPNLLVALYRLSEMLYIENKLLRARAYLERYQSAAGVSPQTLYLGYRIENKAKSINAADEYSEQLFKKFPGSKEAKSLRKKLGTRG